MIPELADYNRILAYNLHETIHAMPVIKEVTRSIMQSLPPGVIVPIITPYHQPDIFRVIDHLKQGGIRAIFLLGTTGEALQIQHQAKLALIRDVADYVKDDMQLLVGISTTELKQAIELMQTAYEVGAVASVISPLVVGDDVMAIVHTLLEAAPGSLMLYNYPAISRNLFIPLAAIQQWCHEKRILGIKDSSGDLVYFQQLLDCKIQHPHFKVYFGPEKQLQQVIQLPIDGFVPGTGNLAPALAARLWLEKASGPWQAWNATKQAIIEAGPSYIQGLKMMMQQRGLISASLVFPGH